MAGKRTTRKQMILSKKRQKKAELQARVDVLRGKELQAKSEAERLKHVASRTELQYLMGKIRLRTNSRK